MERIWENRRTTDNWDLGDFLPFTLSIRGVRILLPFRDLYFDEINNAYFILRVYIVGLFASGMNGMSRKKLLEQLYQDVLSQRMKSGIADKISSKKTRSFLTDFLLKKF